MKKIFFTIFGIAIFFTTHTQSFANAHLPLAEGSGSSSEHFFILIGGIVIGFFILSSALKMMFSEKPYQHQ